MPREYALADLVDDAGTVTESESSESGGEWVNTLFDKLEENGVVDAILQEKVGGGQTTQTSPTPPQPSPRTDGGNAEATSAGPDLDAEGVKQILLVVYDKGGSVPGLPEDPKVSDLIKLIEKYPGMAEQLIGQYMAGEGV